MKQQVNQRTRVWTFVIYPDSQPDDWMEYLKAIKVKGFISPLHTDINPDETEKKPHRHVMLMFDSVKSFEQVKVITDHLNAPHPQYVQSKVAMARYLCHLDNPEKKQYEPKDVVCIAGADYIGTIETAADLDKVIDEMEQWCDDNGVVSYAGLSSYARKYRPEWRRALRYRCTVHMKAYLQARQWEVDHQITYTYPEEQAHSEPKRCSFCGSSDIAGGLADEEGNLLLYCEDCREMLGYPDPDELFGEAQS